MLSACQPHTLGLQPAYQLSEGLVSSLGWSLSQEDAQTHRAPPSTCLLNSQVSSCFICPCSYSKLSLLCSCYHSTQKPHHIGHSCPQSSNIPLTHQKAHSLGAPEKSLRKGDKANITQSRQFFIIRQDFHFCASHVIILISGRCTLNYLLLRSRKIESELSTVPMVLLHQQKRHEN